MSFQLTSHEVMRGVKLRDGELVIGQGGGVIAWSVLRAAIGSAFLVGGVQAGGLGWVVGVYGLLFGVEGLLWIRCRVVASPDGVRVTNRFRRHRVDLADFEVRVVTKQRWLPVVPEVSFSWYPAYEFGEAILDHGERLRLDALVGAPGDTAPDPSPVWMKVAVLNRYRESVP